MGLVYVNFTLLSFGYLTSAWSSTNASVFVEDYCSIKCNGKEHTMCKYKRPSPTCMQFEVSYDSATGRIMHQRHNKLRNDLAKGLSVVPNLTYPKASNMRYMEWDQELAAIAHKWLTQCIIGHDECRDTKNYTVGQNVGFVLEEDVDLLRDPANAMHMFNKWRTNMGNVSEADVISLQSTSTATSDIVQIMWANTYKLGCSDVIFWKSTVEHQVFACNYAPKGNLIGEPIYKAGNVCTGCPVGFKCNTDQQFDSLCIREGMEEEDFDLPNISESVTHSVCPLLVWTFLVTAHLQAIFLF